MNFVIDFLLICILLLGIFFGIKRGFVKTVTKPVKLVATWVCAFKFCTFVSEKIFAPLISGSVSDKLAEILKEKCANLTPENASDEIPTVLKIAAGIFDIDVNSIAQDSGASFAQKVADTFTQPIVSILSTVVSFIVLLLVFSILFSVVLWLINGIFHIGPLAWLNKTLGLVFGFAFAFIIAWLISILIGYIFSFDSLTSLGTPSGVIYRFFKEYHPLDILLGF